MAEMLIALGFSQSQANEALDTCNGNVEAAANYLLSNNSVAEDKGEIQTLHAPLSQYSVDSGRSACTCMALYAAQEYLQNPIMTAERIEECIRQGSKIYRTLQTTVEHTAVDDVISAFPSLQIRSTHQDMLHRDRNMGLMGVLSRIQGPACCIVTKPPETVLVILPPPNSHPYILLDTHPRPQQFSTETAYARLCTQPAGLYASLEDIFAKVELSDVDPFAMQLYNAFEVTVVGLKEE